MRGPSSSHTAGSYRIGKMVRSLLDAQPSSVTCTFDPDGSYAKTYQPQGVDLAFLTGLMDWPLTDDRFFKVKEFTESLGIHVEFKVLPLGDADHPNTIQIEISSRDGKRLTIAAKSIGGGAVVVTRFNGWNVRMTGKCYEVLVEAIRARKSEIIAFLESVHFIVVDCQEQDDTVLIHFQGDQALDDDVKKQLETLDGVRDLWMTDPLFFIKRGESLFSTAKEMVFKAEDSNCSLGEIAMAFESQLLGLPREELMEEMIHRFEVMKESVKQGLKEDNIHMMLLRPSAEKLLHAERSGKVAIGGIHTRAAARALAAMHTSNSMGVVCAAPTGGSGGVLPGVVFSLAEEKNVDPAKAAMLLFTAGAVGFIIANRATFAAEIAGCQVEIGAAGAMAAAAVVEFAGGTAQQAVDAAAIALQNTMGSICDLVQGACEIPCHTRNAVAASNAFLCGDLILGGYQNPIPLDETIDAMYAVGQMLPSELRCTSLGGIAVTPSALSLPVLR